MMSIILLTLLFIYLIVSRRVNRTLGYKNDRKFWGILIAYISISLVLVGFIYKLDMSLRSRGIFLEFGHGSIMLIGFLLACALIALINIVMIFLKRTKK
jgi:hypothetical protein